MADDELDGGGLRRQLEEALQKQKELEQSLPAQIQEAEQRGATQAERRFKAQEIFGKDRPGLAESWVEKNPEGELTTDAAKEWAGRFGVSLEEAPPEPPPAPTAQVPDEVKQAADAFHGAAPVVPGQSQQTYTSKEIQEIGLKNEAEALRLIAEGAMKTE